MRGLQSFRWPVKLAMLVIALLKVNRRTQRTGSAPIISAGIFSHACWPPPAFRWGR